MSFSIKEKFATAAVLTNGIKSVPQQPEWRRFHQISLPGEGLKFAKRQFPNKAGFAAQRH
jgi:hypothetical protein